ncbi:MAG: PhzF family phenazine biosynthesis protein [Hyphomicrobiaceae bacterium]
MELPIFVVDAFADRAFEGNPAAVCPLAEWLPVEWMQAIAAEMNLSETAFIVPAESAAGTADYDIRWFTPTREVELIGHATLAAGFVVLDLLGSGRNCVGFTSGPHRLTVTRLGTGLALEMPALRPRRLEACPPALAEGLGRRPAAVLAAKHYLCVFDTAAEVASLAPDMGRLAGLDLPAVIVTAPATPPFDFVSRFFAPANGVPEDPVSGVAHLCLAPYWADRLGRTGLTGRQLSRRGGTVVCDDLGERVRLSGGARLFLEGRLRL